jgi:deoxycytidine triphosphate deaminase
MSTLITQDELLQIVQDPNGFLTNADPSCVEGIKYDFRFSGRFLKARHGRGLNVADFSPADTESIRIEPGETVFVLTEESLHLPKDVKAELSHKRKLAHQGVQILGGFCVDPLYKGKLMFGMYNFSSEPFPLIKGKKLIAAQFYRLSEDEQDSFPVPKEPIEDFPRDVVGIIRRFVGVSAQALGQKVEELTILVRNLRDDIDKRKEWFEKMEGFIASLGKSVQELKESLEEERARRQKGEDALAERLGQIDKMALRHDILLRVMNWIGGLILAVVTGVVVYFVIQGLTGTMPSP